MNKCILYEISLSYLKINSFNINTIYIISQYIINHESKRKNNFNMEKNKTLSLARIYNNNNKH